MVFRLKMENVSGQEMVKDGQLWRMGISQLGNVGMGQLARSGATVADAMPVSNQQTQSVLALVPSDLLVQTIGWLMLLAIGYNIVIMYSQQYIIRDGRCKCWVEEVSDPCENPLEKTCYWLYDGRCNDEPLVDEGYTEDTGYICNRFAYLHYRVRQKRWRCF